MAFTRESSPGYLVNHLAREMANTLQKRIEPKGSSTGQFPLLLLLWERDGISQGDISRRLGIEQPTVANTLKRMERDGLILRQPDASDGRRALITLTAKAKGLKEPLIAEAVAVNGFATQGLDAKEVESFIRIVKKMILNLERCEP